MTVCKFIEIGGWPWYAYCAVVVFGVMPMMWARHSGWNKGWDERGELMERYK